MPLRTIKVRKCCDFLKRLITVTVCISAIHEISLFGETGFEKTEQLASIRNFLAIGEYGEAEALGRVLLKNSEQEGTDLLALMGTVASKQGKWRQAARYYIEASEIAKDDPERQRFFILAGDAYYRNSDYTLAEALYKDSYDCNSNEETLFRYGCALLKRGKIVEAEALHFTSRGIRERFEWNCAAYWYDRGMLRKALEYLMRWIEVGVPELSFYEIAAQILYRLGYLREALDVVAQGEKFCIKDIKYSNSHIKLLKRRIRQCLYGEIETVFHEEGGDQSFCRRLLWDCVSYLDGNWEELFNKGLEVFRVQFPKEAEFIEGMFHERQGRYEKALDVFHHLEVKNSGTNRMCYLAKYRVVINALQLGNLEEAREYLRNLQRELPDQTWMKAPRVVEKYLEKLQQRSQSSQKRLF